MIEISERASVTNTEEYAPDEATKELLQYKPGITKIPFAFEDAAEMLNFFYPPIQSGDINLHKWQTEVLELLCKPTFTKSSPLRFILAAANGSGKDAYVIAPFAIWHCMCKIRSRCIITSSSYNQLKSQTENYIRTLAQIINAEVGHEVFLIKQMHIICKETGSEIFMFCTDDAGRAEGFHPFADYKNAELCLLMNESKTIGDNIFDAFKRCDGYNRWIEVSSPGKTSGHMFTTYKRSVMYPEPMIQGQWYSRKVTAYDCPHKSINEIEEDKIDMGEHSPLFRSKNLAEFTSLDEQVVITQEALQKCLAYRSDDDSFIDLGIGKRSGLDLAVGGDENALVVTEGNKIIGEEYFRASDPSLTVDLVISFWQKYGMTPEQVKKGTFADHGGVGAVFAAMFRDKGWEPNWIMNQSRAMRTDRFGNRGAELWWNFKRLIEECMLMLPKNNLKLHSQLTSRYYKQQENTGKIILESKREAKSKGHGSPDRADALVLAFTGISVQDLRNAENGVVRKINKGIKHMTQEALVNSYNERKWAEFEDKLGHLKTSNNKNAVNKSRNPGLIIQRSYGYANNN